MKKRFLKTPLIFAVIFLFISISISSYGIIMIELPEGNIKKVSPMDHAVFLIEVTNPETTRTQIYFEVESLPKGWFAYIVNNTIIAANSKIIGRLIVTPPRGFGYHDDTAIIKIKITPGSPVNTSARGNPHYVTVMVESRGFSLGGIESVLTIIIIITCIALVGYLFYRRKTKK